MESDLKDIEAELAKLTPQGMPDDILARMDEAMCRWHESVPVEEKVISLNESVAPNQGAMFQWRSVAAVALFGASAALYFTNGNSADATNPVTTQSAMQAGTVSNATFIPRQAKAEVVGYQDRGYVTSPSGQTLQAVGVKVSNQVHFRNANGDRVKLEKPSMEVIFVPLDVD